MQKQVFDIPPERRILPSMLALSGAVWDRCSQGPYAWQHMHTDGREPGQAEFMPELAALCLGRAAPA